jgi:division protein CdvB (Snf7/Vps24/ESCRT-III family)
LDVISFSIIRKFEGKLHQPTLKERVEQASFRLHTQQEKLDHMYSRLRQRDTDLFQRCVGAQLSNDSAHAKIYANECAEIRKIAKVVLGSQLALEKVILRLETVEEFGTIMAQMAPVMGIVKETKSKIAGIVPQVANELEGVNEMLSDLSNETGEVTAAELPIEASDDEAKKVLAETSEIAEERLRDHFPVLPSMAPNLDYPQLSLEPASNAPEFNGDFQERIIDYAKKHDGELSIQTCASDLGSSPEDVKVALQKLRDTGKVVIE